MSRTSIELLKEERKRIVERCNEVFTRMMELHKAKRSRDPEYIELIKKYDALVLEEEAVMKRLGISIDSPCPVPGGMLCEECTGYIKSMGMGSSGIIYVRVHEGQGDQCALKFI